MNGITVPFLPTGLWLLATSGCIVVVVAVFAMHWYQRRRFQAALGDSRDVADLAARKEILQADVQGLRSWLAESKEELSRIQSEREEQERLRGELSRLQNECLTLDQRLIDSRKEAGDLESQRYRLAQEKEKLSIDIDELLRQRQDLADLKTEINSAKKELDAAKEEFTETKRSKTEIVRQVAEKRLELDTLHRECDGLDRSRQVFEQDAENAKTEARRCQQETADAANGLNNIVQQIQVKQTELIQTENIFHELERKTRYLEHKNTEAEGILTSLEKKKVKAEKSASEAEEKARSSETDYRKVVGLLERAEIKLEEAEKKEKRLGAEVVRLEAERGHLLKEIGKLDGGGGEADAYADLFQAPPCLDRNLLPKNEFKTSDEEYALANIRNQLATAGYQFHPRVIKAFHTALKCHDINPLTVLAGVSGTGKTLLPTAYAKLMGMHSLVIAVQPRWDSPQDMFGFYNYLEKKYKATDLARTLIRMDPYSTVDGLDEKQKCSDRMLLVLLDEMNLARTEYYFSEFLSKLELRRLAGDGRAEVDRQHAEILLDTGPGRQPIKFWVGKNVLFTGTMNEDESTQTLSDKVLDRANVLRFGRPANIGSEGQQQAQEEQRLPNPEGYLTVKQWKDWCRPVQQADWTGKAQEWIDGLNDALTKIGRPFGHRVRKSILAYVANYPAVNMDIFKIAFADQVEQKILPKLRGLDTTEGVNNAACDEIEKIIEATGDNTLHRAFASARENNVSGMFLWQGVTRLDD